MTGKTSDDEPAYEADVRDGVLRIRQPGTEWLSTGWNGGRVASDRAYNVSVPEGWSRTDLAAYVGERLDRSGFETGYTEQAGDAGRSERRKSDAPVLLTGVDLAHARGARCGPVTVYATAGLSNPAALPMDPGGGPDPSGTASDEASADLDPTGTVNLLVGTTRALAPGALANVIAVAAETKAATLLANAGFPGTTTDAIVAGHDPTGQRAAFSGSETEVGAATRACVREAVRASLRSRYDGRNASVPQSVADASDGVSTDVRARVFHPTTDGNDSGAAEHDSDSDN